MRAGRLNRRVTVQRAVESQGAMGGLAQSWVDVVSVWAAVEPLRGSERFRAQQVKAELSYRVTMRYRPEPTPKMRLKIGNRILRIEEVINPSEAGIELQLLCSEWVEV